MSIDAKCECGAKYRVGDAMAGKRVRCKKCGGEFTIPPAAVKDAADDDFGAYGVAGESAGADDVWAQEARAAPAPLPKAKGFGTLRERDRATPPPPPTPARDEPSPLPRGSVVLNGTVASNPARMAVDAVAVVRSFPFGAILSIVVGVGIAVAAVRSDKPVVLVVAVLTPVLFLYNEHKEMRQKFNGGCVNPGVVVSASPYRVAVFTDLTKGRAARPAVKIVRQPLQWSPRGRPKVGDRVATAALYYGGTGADAWGDFVPIAADCVTRNAADVARMMGTITARDWRDLEQAMAALGDQREGLHTLWDDDRRGARYRRRRRPRPVLIGFLLLLAAPLALVAWRIRHPATPAEAPPPPITAAPARAPAVTPARRPPAARPDATRSPASANDGNGGNGDGNEAAARPESARRPAAGGGASSKAERPAMPPAAGSAAAQASKGEEGFSAVRVEPDAPGKAPADAPAKVPPEPAPPAAGPGYEAGQAVEVLWGGKWYAGRVVKPEGAKTRVHYDGWSENFDESVGPERIRRR